MGNLKVPFPISKINRNLIRAAKNKSQFFCNTESKQDTKLKVTEYFTWSVPPTKLQLCKACVFQVEVWLEKVPSVFFLYQGTTAHLRYIQFLVLCKHIFLQTLVLHWTACMVTWKIFFVRIWVFNTDSSCMVAIHMHMNPDPECFMGPSAPRDFVLGLHKAKVLSSLLA